MCGVQTAGQGMGKFVSAMTITIMILLFGNGMGISTLFFKSMQLPVVEKDLILRENSIFRQLYANNNIGIVK